jgi:agmatine/peptidylarginine deiminase
MFPSTLPHPGRRLLDDEFWNASFPSTQSRCDQVDANVAPYVSSKQDFTPVDRRAIAEYEPMQGVSVACIYKDSLCNEWGGFGVPISLLEEIAKDVKLYVLVSPADDAVAKAFCSNLLHNVDEESVVYIDKTLDTWWVRDYGALWVTNSQDGAFVVDHIYNRVYKVEWDYGGCRVNDNNVPAALAQHLGVKHEYAPAVLTGGNYMVSTKGEGMAVNKVFVNNAQSKQNESGFKPFNDWEDDAIEEELKKVMAEYYGIKHFYTPSDPQDTYIDHVDTWGKWVQDSDGLEVLVMGKYPEEDKNSAAMESLVGNVTADITAATGEAPVIKRVTLAKVGPTGTTYGIAINSLILNNKLFVPLIAGANGTATEEGSDADLLNKQVLEEWQTILGEKFTVIGYEHDVPAPGAAHDEYPPENDASTWNIWFTWDALHCRLKGVPDINFFAPAVPDAPASPSNSVRKRTNESKSSKSSNNKMKGNKDNNENKDDGVFKNL